ncbi:MAG: copper chaperone PCu(A)C [Betaproteobacteria bacterium]|nr:copper chaperone PCu(A)C [Betaproteobacteria bacterium]
MKRQLKALCVAGFVLTSAQAWAEVTVSEAWVRGTVPSQKVTGAFMKIKSSEDAKLVSASSPAAKIVEVHEMAMKGNVMTMRAIDALALPAGKAVELKPGGYHVMLIDLVKPLGKGDTVPVTLTVVGKDGKKSNLEIKAEVRAPDGTPAKR